MMSNRHKLFSSTPLRKRYRDDKFPIIAGYCTLRSRKSTLRMSSHLEQIKNVVAQRGSAYKTRTSPFSFQGVGREGLEWLKETYEKYELPIVTEIISASHARIFIDVFGPHLGEYVILQVGARNMQNTVLLRELCRMRKEYGVTVLLKRGMCANFKEIIGALQYLRYEILDDGTRKLVRPELPILLCLRGIRDLDYRGPYRFFPDIEDIPLVRNELKERGLDSVLVGFDPSHPAGNHAYVGRIAEKAVEHGADFLLIETMLNEDEREQLLCDKEQAITINALKSLIQRLQEIFKTRGEDEEN